MNRKVLWMLAVCIMMIALLAACGNNNSNGANNNGQTNQPTTEPTDKPANEGEQNQPPQEEDQEPVEITVGLSLGWLGQEGFDQYFVEPVKKLYPNITVTAVDIGNPEYAIDKLILAGKVPDIYMSASPIIYRFMNQGLEFDIEPFIKKHGYDLTRLDPVAVESVKQAGQTDFLTGLPWTRNVAGLYYNKDIFDQFGIEYPHDGMTWEEVRTIAADATRMVGDVQYRGFEPDQPSGLGAIRGLTEIDPTTLKATVNTDEWKHVFEIAKSIYDIPGNNAVKYAGGAWEQFFKDKTLAMYAAGSNYLAALKDAQGLNWGVAQYPSYADMPNIGPVIDMWILHITQQSKNKDAAFKVLASITSDEVQTDMAKNARYPILANQSIVQHFGENMDHLQGVDLNGMFKTTPAQALPVTPYGGLSQPVMQNAMAAVAKGEKDINTALREADELINQAVESAKAK